MRVTCGTILAAIAALVVNADVVGSPYGACAHITRDEPPARTCAMMRQAGMGWVRSDFDWRSIERKRGEWDFSCFDKVVSTCEAEGMQFLPILGYSVPWANPVGPGQGDPYELYYDESRPALYENFNWKQPRK